jgi:hypothetical protein
MAKESIKGISETIKELRAFGKDIEKLIDAETSDIADQIESDAKTKAPKNFGKLAQSIGVKKVKSSEYKIYVNESYGAYIEFGTGTKVKVPSEFTEIALQFKGKGRGPQLMGNSFDDGLRSIEEWCLSKGISIFLAKFIFLKILGAGINPQPFLYPAWVKGRKDYLTNLTKLLKAYKKKI